MGRFTTGTADNVVECGLMKVPLVDITRFIKDDLTQQVIQLKKKKINPRMAVFLVGATTQQLENIKVKQKVAKELGVELDITKLDTAPPFLQFANLLKAKSQLPNVHGVIIEQPLPVALQSDTIYNFIPLSKELNGHRKKTTFLPPIGLTVLTILKYIFQNTQVTAKLYPDPVKDPSFFKQSLKQKKVVLIGRGQITGQPIAQAMSQFRINFINVNSQTYEPEQYYQDADIIVTSVGKKVLKSTDIKPGAALINASAQDGHDGVTGDYDESEIKSVAGFYTPTARGTGMIDTLYLFKNLIEAIKLQV